MRWLAILWSDLLTPHFLLALPAVLAHSGAIELPAMIMSIFGGLLIYGTIISFSMFFQEQEEFWMAMTGWGAGCSWILFLLGRRGSTKIQLASVMTFSLHDLFDLKRIYGILGAGEWFSSIDCRLLA
jgi:hypothetical protein